MSAGPMRSAVLLAATAIAALAGCPGSQDVDFGDDGPDCPAGETCTELPDTCVPDRVVGSFELCSRTTDDSYLVVVTYAGSGAIDLASSELRVNSTTLDAATI